MPAAAQSTAKNSRRVARMGAGRAGTARPNGQQTVDYGTLPQHVGYLLRLAQLRVWDDFYRRVGDTGISPSLYSALILIERNPGLQQSRLGEALGVARSGAMTMVDRLESLKLVERRADPHDRRAYGLFLTATGRARMSQFIARVQEHDKHITAALTPEEHRELMALLQKFIAVPARPDSASEKPSDKRSGIMEREETP
ncbi:MAG TPA: MarR family winged helix-turn-helix transcriptional regulator [Ferrovibrio sp.]|jgi:DNA-binding MarR family transcriptional regulator|uniref:MarR family winged helix-turn-helix transcriptional regulator n=1 Tax=Ferrovibrio sp. TaxID=1917215 RepID=UPI002ED116FF